jgi:hypothetical protein
MERSSENQKVQNESEVIFTSEIEIEEEMKGIEKNPSLQIKFKLNLKNLQIEQIKN